MLHEDYVFEDANREFAIIKYLVNEEEYFLIRGRGDHAQLGCQICPLNDQVFQVSKKDDDLPNFFVDYPLIGSENLGMSVIFNSHKFYPNEKRSGISLDKGRLAELNREVMKECAKLYDKLIDLVLKLRLTNLHHLKLTMQPN